MLTTLAIENYRSLRDLVFSLGRLNVITGANGSGKSNLYRALRLVAETSRNGAVAALAREGGLPSVLWAGPEHLSRSMRDGTHPMQGTVRTDPVSLRLGFASDDFGYAIDFGQPSYDSTTAFNLDPQIKCEALWAGPILRPSALLVDRRAGLLRVRDDDGAWVAAHDSLSSFDSALSEFADPQVVPEMLAVRERIRSWRFYDHFRTDSAAPARVAQVGTRTPVLNHDGSDVAAALQTIAEIGDAAEMARAIDHAFPGARLEIVSSSGRFDLALRQHGLLRPLAAAELSDGTLRYLLWVAALLTPRPPALLVLNEPETSLHPDLLPALAGLVVDSATSSQVMVVSHSQPFVQALATAAASVQLDVHTIELMKDFGQTAISGFGKFDERPWQWPKR
jgi:predicted ATPase